ncbi:MAG: UPF0175 family protein [Verrucomicrobia bacterium]|nr:UPF0175 family protein [Verrucomicrobiota bacterium]
MNVELPDAPAAAAKLTPEEARLSLAVWLYQTERLSFGEACDLAQVPMTDFQTELARRNIPVGYNLAELAHDITDLKALGRL